MRDQLRILCLLIFTALLIVSESRSTNDDQKLRSEIVSNLIQEYQQISGVPGIAIGFAKDDQVWTQFLGSADLENHSEVQRQTKFRMASVSKVITAAAAIRLFEQGKLDIDAPIQKYVPSFPDHPTKITIRMLAGHLGGIRHYLPKDFQDCKHYKSTEEALAIFQHDPLVNEPGTKYFYSSYGFNLIWAAMEKATGKNFAQILKDEIFDPLAMKDSTLDNVQEIIPNRTGFYSRAEGAKIRNADFQDPSSKWAAGGILCTADDLLRFGLAHLGSNYLSTESRAILFTSQRTLDSKETGVGFAWRIGKGSRGRTIYHHAGNMPGARSLILLYPDEKAVVVVLSNLYGEPPLAESTGQIIAETFLQSEEVLRSVKDISANFKISGELSGKEVSGTLAIKRNDSGSYEAILEGLNPLREIAAKNGMPTEIRIPRVFADGENIVLVLVSSGGLTQWILAPTPGGYTTTLEFPLKGSLHFTK